MFQALDDLEGRTEDIPCVVGDEHLWTSDIRHQLSVSVAQRTEKKLMLSPLESMIERRVCMKVQLVAAAICVCVCVCMWRGRCGCL